MPHARIVVVGAPAGGFEALRAVLPVAAARNGERLEEGRVSGGPPVSAAREQARPSKAMRQASRGKTRSAEGRSPRMSRRRE